MHDNVPRKTCFKCDVAKPLTEFYQHPRMADGHLNKCKKCTRYDARVNRRLRIDYYVAYDRRRYHEGRHSPTRSPEKRAVDRIFRAALQSGKIKRLPCEMCGDPKSEGHHPDYSKPLDVMWLCRKHHRDVHRTLEEPDDKYDAA